ncbi:MAG: NAD(P)H-hydrate dehydratase [Proteobacteria bacterium]|nr:NAD(P)H-hydrate dehydratase [Pseudomonadota bacterium]
MERITADRPHPLFDIAATRRLEQAAAANLPPHTLMRRAGLAAARLGLALAPHARTVWVACGPGNNGGDGLEAAMHLHCWGKKVVVTWLGDEARAPADALASLARAREVGVPFADAPPAGLERQDLCIDALLGIGARRAPEGRMAEWLSRQRQSGAVRLAIDLPSGLDADSGAFAPEPIATSEDSAFACGRFDRQNTLSLLTLKPGLFTAHGRDAAGQVWFDDLGVASAGEAPTAHLSGPPPAQPRAHASHKGSYGDVAVIGGAPGMTGAALLAGTAALHGGAGRVFVALLDPAAATVDMARPELMLRAPASLSLEALTAVCGCGGGDAVRRHLPDVLARAKAAVLDADALNAIAGDEDLQALLRARADRDAAAITTVLTPHPLEAARLLATHAAEVQADRLGAARRLAERFGCVVVLKGSGTVIAAPGQTPTINPTGNGRLATAGTGDVLAGMVGARIASGRPAFAAAREAVYLHGLAADRWPIGRALTAGELARR